MTIVVQKDWKWMPLAVLLAGALVWLVVMARDASAVKAENRQLRADVVMLKEDVAAGQRRITELNTALSAEKAARGKADAEVLRLSDLAKKLLAQNAAYQQQIATMTDERLLEEMARRLGATEVGMARGGDVWRFSLTRLGGERAVSLFSERETYFTLSQNQALQIDQYIAKNASLERSLVIEANKTDIERAARVAALEALDRAMLQIRKTESAMSSGKRKSFLFGLATGAAAGVVAKSLFD